MNIGRMTNDRSSEIRLFSGFVGFKCILVTDGLAQYHLLEDHLEGLTNANCWAHAIRDFSDAVKAIKDPELAKRSTPYQALVRIGAIYKPDESLKGLTPQQRLKERQKNVKPLVEEYFVWVRAVSGSQLPEGATASGLNYSINQEKYLRVFLDDGEKLMYEFKKKIAPLHSTSTFGRSLYQAEEEVNDFEYEMVMALTGLDNMKWWHRNISRQEFCINGFANHYPDFIVMTKRGKILMIETKGDHLENRETKDKLVEGRAWQNLAGALYRYFLVFKSKDLDIEGARQS